MSEIFTREKFVKFAGEKAAAKFFLHLKAAMDQFQINTKLRICHFMGQVAHESGMFFYVEEIASGKAYDTGQLALNLGNTPEADGDGQKFKGRGLIQITGTNNYKRVKKDLGIDCIAQPELLELPRYATMTAALYWEWKKLNVYADADDILKITKLINGGKNGLEDRIAKTNKAKEIF